jgi:hypothetical protein
MVPCQLSRRPFCHFCEPFKSKKLWATSKKLLDAASEPGLRFGISRSFTGAGGADDCHAQILQPATGCPLGQPAPDASQPNPHHSAHPFSGAHAGAVAVRYRIHRNANALHRHGCEGRKFDRNRGWWLPVRSWRAGSQEAPTSTAGGSPQGLLSRAVQQRQQNEAHPATSSPASNVD